MSRRHRIHPAWIVAVVAFIALIGAAGFRAAPSVLMVPIEQEFGTPRAVLALAVSINLLFFGLTAPFAAALMQKVRHPHGHLVRSRGRRPRQRRQHLHHRALAAGPQLGRADRRGYRLDGPHSGRLSQPSRSAVRVRTV